MEVFELGNRLAHATTPDFGTTHLLSCALDLFPTADPDVKTRRMMDAGTDVAPAGYFADGAGGRGLCTYLGPLVLDQLGRERVRSLPAPAVVTELASGGLRVDLTPEPSTQLGPITRESWRRCMEHLAPAGWFSTMTLSETGWVTATPPQTPGWNPGGQVR